MTGTRQILGPRLRIDSDQNRRRAICGGDSGGHAATGIDGNSESCAEKRSVVGDLRGQVQFIATLFGERQTDQAARMPGHEIDDFRRDFFRGAHQVAFVLAIFVVNDDDHPPVANVR